MKELIEFNGRKVIGWRDAHFYPRQHKLGFHAGVRCSIRDRGLRYNQKKERWEEPILEKNKEEQ